MKLQNANQSLVEELIQKLNQLRSEMLELEVSGLTGTTAVQAGSLAESGPGAGWMGALLSLSARQHGKRRLLRPF